LTAATPRYRILRRLGQGGMAEVFEAELVAELGFSRKVAIKRMLASVATDGESARRFLDEARIASKLHHANIVSIVDFGLLDGLPFQVLELVDGVDAHVLASRSGGVLPIDIALVIASGIAHALDHAHTAEGPDGLPLGIVHRDVKPSNVLVSWGGDVKLTDFGIAIAHERAAKTEAGMVPGTLGFIAPEQRTKSTVDGRADVFALGLTLHAMVTGYTPLRDVTAELGLLAGSPVPLDASLPDDLRRLVARAVAPARLDRPTAAQLADEIGAALAQRLPRDPRAALRAFLDPLREKAPKVGVLDQLLGFEVVASSQPDAEVAEYELRKTEALTATARDAEPSALAVEPVRRRRALAWAIEILAVGAFGFFAWRYMTHRGHDSAPRDAAPAVVAPVPIVDGPAAVVAADEPPADAAAAVVVAPVVRDAGQLRTHVVHDAPRPAPVDAPLGTGYLQIVGEDNIGAKILVDGREVGFAPNKLEVARGHRHVEVVRKDGTRVAHDVDITDYDTVAHPARPSF
jgi:serine/threonine-protein kinase